MTFDQLYVVLEISSEGSLSKAAQKMYVSQPSISKTLRLVEKELGFSLFQRSKNGIFPTPEGRTFLQYAEETLQKYRLIQSNAGANVMAGNRSLSVITTGIDVFKLAFTRQVSESEDAIDVMRYLVASLSDCYAMVGTGMMDIGLVHCPDIKGKDLLEYLESGGMEVQHLGNLDSCITVSKNSPLSRFDEKSIDPQALSQFRVAFPYEENHILRGIMSGMKDAFNCDKEAYMPRLYSEEDYLRIMGSRLYPQMYELQVYTYSDWIQNIYNPDEFRCVADTEPIYNRIGKEYKKGDGISRIHVNEQPFRWSIFSYHKAGRQLNSIEKVYLSRIRELMK